jgi:hypothetical protein
VFEVLVDVNIYVPHHKACVIAKVFHFYALPLPYDIVFVEHDKVLIKLFTWDL